MYVEETVPLEIQLVIRNTSIEIDIDRWIETKIEKEREVNIERMRDKKKEKERKN